jgi:hypothetical protein
VITKHASPRIEREPEEEKREAAQWK